MAEGDQAVTDPVDLGAGDVTAEPEPKPFDWAAEMPLDKFPEAMRESLKGKTFEGFATDHTKMRQIASKLGARNKELEAEIQKAGEQKPPELSDDEVDELLKERQDKAMVQQPDYREVLQGYIETDEVPDEFLDVVEKNGVRVSRRDVLKFMAYVKQDRQQKIENMTTAADGQAEGQDLWDWMESEECTLTETIVEGFNEQAEENDYGWVGLVVKKYNEWIEGGGKQASRKGQSRFRGPTRRGRPTQPKAGEGEIRKDDFASEYMKLGRQQARGEITKADEIKAKRILEQRRRATAD